VGVTDNNCYRFLAGRPGVAEVNYWQPSGAREFRVLAPRQALLRLARFADLPDTHPGWLDRAVQLVEPRSPRWTALPQEQISDLTRVCEPAMRRLYGYSW
jgi:hypothetical protein